MFHFHEKDSREEFIRQLGDLANGRMPEEWWDAEQDLDDTNLDDTPPPVKIIISIREDFLGQLEERSRDIPTIFNNRVRLKPLSVDQAIIAIEEPAKEENPAITTQGFSFHKNAVNEMLKFLRKQRRGKGWFLSDEVAPFQLQIICQYHEKRLHDATTGGSVNRNPIVHARELREKGGMKKVLQNYYHRQLRQVVKAVKSHIEGKKSKVRYRKLRKLCENILISPDGWKISIPEDRIKKKFHFKKVVLDKLIASRLLRSEPRLGTNYYELSHDSLLVPLIGARNKRRVIRSIFTVSLVLLAIYVLGTKYILPWYDAYRVSQQNKENFQITVNLRNLTAAIDGYKKKLEERQDKGVLLKVLHVIHCHAILFGCKFMQYHE